MIRRCAWLAAIVILALPGGLSFSHMVFVMAILGFSGALGNVELGTYLLQNAPEDMLARVTGTGRLLSFGACAVGPMLGGIVAEEYGIRTAVVLLLAAILALSLFSFLMPSAGSRKKPRCLPPVIISELAEANYPELILANPREATPASVLAAQR
jgi:MFS family permease